MASPALQASQSRPEPMNASPYHSKVKVTITLSDPLFVAGGHVSGKVELECRADKGLGIGVIMVELLSIQELTSRDHSATSTYLHLTRRFQGPGLPPSNAVHPYPLPGSEPLPAYHFPARKGITTFFFRFPVPTSSPSSIDFGKGLAKLRYEVKASVGVGWKGERRLVTDKKDVDVVEAFDDTGSELGEKVVIGENGKVWVQGRVVNRVVVSGQQACVELHVKNHSHKKTTSLSLALMRHLHLPSVSHTSNVPKTLQISDTLLSLSFKGPEYIVIPGTEGMANLVFDVPMNARGVKGGPRDGGDEDDMGQIVEGHPSKLTDSLFEVKCIIGIKIGMGLGSKDIQLDLPVTIVHPAALPMAPLLEAYPSPLTPLTYSNTLNASDTPFHLASQPHFSPTGIGSNPASPRLLPSIPSNPGLYFNYAGSHPTSPSFQSPYTFSPSPPLHRQTPERVWSPLSHSAYPLGYVLNPSDHISSYPTGQQYYFPPPPVIYDQIRPNSADPYAAQQLPLLPVSREWLSSGPSTTSATYQLSSTQSTPGKADGAEGEVGKGDRASRISAHLRFTSRHRSVSPQSHRFPLLLPPPVPAPVSIPVQPVSTSSPLDQTYLSASPARSAQSTGEVLSPRPMLSPKNSYTIDPVTSKGTLGKSERVEVLERMAAQEVKRAQMETEELAIDKTLPKVPESASTLPRAGSVFASLEVETPKLPPQPTLAPVNSAKLSRPDYSGRESGLEVLERKLLEQVGTRKPDKLADRKADIRTVLPIFIPSADQEVPLPTNDSAISSLSLAEQASEEMSEMRKKKAGGERSAAKDDLLERGRDRSPRSKGPVKYSEVRQLRKAATGRVAAWLGGIESPIPPVQASTHLTSSPKISHGEISPAKEVPQTSLGQSLETVAVDDARTKSSTPRPEVTSIPTRSSGFILHATTKGNTTFEAPSEPDGASRPVASNCISLSPNSPPDVGNFGPSVPKSSPAKPNGSSKYVAVPKASSDEPATKGPAISPRLFPPAAMDLQSKYDVRSARGGRGGKVHSVAAMWTSLTQAEGNGAKPTTLNINQKLSNSNQKSPLVPDKSSPKDADLAARRVRMIKSASVPASVSSSLATPVLSSTASLARPSPFLDRSKAAISVPPTASESLSGERPTPRTAAVNGEFVFGQAKLKDLIKKYQK